MRAATAVAKRRRDEACRVSETSPGRLTPGHNVGTALLKESLTSAGDRMKHILDSEFRYRPSFDTDVRKTFEKVRRQQQQVRERDIAAAAPETRVKVLKLEQLKKATT
jgi:hypothetical protein